MYAGRFHLFAKRIFNVPENLRRLHVAVFCRQSLYVLLEQVGAELAGSFVIAINIVGWGNLSQLAAGRHRLRQIVRFQIDNIAGEHNEIRLQQLHPADQMIILHRMQIGNLNDSQPILHLAGGDLIKRLFERLILHIAHADGCSCDDCNAQHNA